MTIAPIPHSNNYDINTQRFEWLLENKHICRLPWTTRQYFFQTGTVTPCCNLINEETVDYFKPVIEVIDSIESGQTNPMCDRCYQCEADGKMSERIRSMIGIDTDKLQGFLQTRSVDGFFVHATLSSLCNMACRSCNSEVSSLYKKIWEGADTEPKTMSDDSRYWQSFLDSIKRAVADNERVVLVISGGEGLVQQDFYTLIEWLRANDLDNKIELQLNTNGSINKTNLFEDLAKSFKIVRLVISVDSVYDNYYYVRYPVKWEKIKQHLEIFAGYKKSIENFDFILTPVFSINNIFYLRDYVEFFEGFTAQHDLELPVYDTPLYQPEYLDIQYLPVYLKQILIDDILVALDNQYLKQKYNVSFYTSVSRMLELIKNQYSTSLQQGYWTEYLKTTARWDKLTNVDFAIYNKKLYDQLLPEDKKLFNNYKLFQLTADNK